AEKRSRDAKERSLDSKDGKGPERGPGPRYDREEGRGRPLDSYMPLNSKKVHVLHYILQARLADLPPRKPDKVRMG
ncbi:hypothetical protein A2U01_0100041, partial [Trifolium medium]|nr:hypothetical protein [Trifolium medium]